MSKDYFVIIIKYSEPEKTTGPSGVIPIAVLKEESTIVEILLHHI
jgi:hypothetical protein